MARTRASLKSRRLRVAFCHPDLGLGGALQGLASVLRLSVGLTSTYAENNTRGESAGAERLIVDAATELAGHGHQVDVFTAFHDPQRCFAETVDGPFSVTVAGGWFPRHVAGRLHALCAYIRCTLVALYIAWLSWRRGVQYDVVIVDQVSVVNCVLHGLTTARILFYCHFPDLLLARHRSWLHTAYRTPLDWLEQVTTGAADLVLVNSAFTRGIFAQTFSRLHARGIYPGVLYPAVSIPASKDIADAEAAWRDGLPAEVADFVAAGPTFLSINRFERKKGIGLAISALHDLLQRSKQFAACRLVVAGGYDSRLAENVEHLQELEQLAEQLGVRQHVRFMPSFSDRQRAWLLAACVGVLYTPQHEHFGIVPLEAMAAGRPVLACDSGGPRESVISGKTGYLCQPNAGAWADAMEALLQDGKAARLGASARRHVQSNFSRAAFGQALNDVVLQLASSRLQLQRAQRRRRH